MAYDKNLTKKSEDLSSWYNRIVLEAELADYGPARGSMIYRPYGYAIWELVQQYMDRKIKDRGVENAYFPLLIPESYLKKEAKHVEGFSPELAVVTVGGGEELAEKLVIRPTSETIMYNAYSQWVHSWRDLPLLINQWNNVVRWEKRTYLLLRTSEFLWQEGHTAHATHEEATEMAKWGIEMYAQTYREMFAVPGYIGKKSDAEKFAGADMTLTYEALMPEGKVLQACTSHDLGQNFSKAFGIKFQDKDGSTQFAWQTSWGFSTRSIGALIMIHGDDLGLRLPPKLAPIQVTIVPVKTDDHDLLDYAKALSEDLKSAGIRAKIDVRDGETFGFKLNKWEVKGVPFRIEVGAKEMQEKVVTLARRDVKEKIQLPISSLSERIIELLDEIQKSMYKNAEDFLQENTREANSYDDFKRIMQEERGFILANWCENAECETKIKEETKASVRCLTADNEGKTGDCIYCKASSKNRWLFAQSY